MAQSQDEIDAQQKFFQRANGPVIGARSTFGKQPNKIFRENQEQGRIPKHFKSWADAEEQFLARIKQGVKPAVARQQLGLTYENVLGHPYFDVVLDRYTGETRGFNKRAVNEDLHPLAERDLRIAYGRNTAQEFRAQLKDGWGDYKKRVAYDPMSISAQDEAKAVRNYLTSFLGRGDPRDQGGQSHRGHGFSASQSGGSLNLMDLFPELGWTNVHGHQGLAGNPRMHPDVMHDNNMASTAEEGFFFDLLDREGNTINPRATQWPSTFIAVDENANEIRRKIGPMNYDVGPAIEQNPGVSSDALAAQQRRRDELMAQMGQPGPRQAINQANRQSIIMDNTQSVGTPVRILQQGIPIEPPSKPAKVTAVSPDGSERTYKQQGPTKADIIARLVRNGVPLQQAQGIADRMIPIPNKPKTIPAPEQQTVNLIPSQGAAKPTNQPNLQAQSITLGKVAAAIATREPLPVPSKPPAKPPPKPPARPPAKPAAKPTPVVAAKTTKIKPTSASMQIRAMQNTVPDVINIYPGMGSPSNSLIQGI